MSIPLKIQWVVRYRDGSEATNLDGDPWDVPRTNVMAVLQRGHHLVDIEVQRSAEGAWVWKDGSWVALHSQWAIWDYLGTHFEGRLVVLRGEMLPDPLWADRRAMYEDTTRLFGTGKTLYKPTPLNQLGEDTVVAANV